MDISNCIKSTSLNISNHDCVRKHINEPINVLKKKGKEYFSTTSNKSVNFEIGYAVDIYDISLQWKMSNFQICLINLELFILMFRVLLNCLQEIVYDNIVNGIHKEQCFKEYYIFHITHVGSARYTYIQQNIFVISF